MPCIAILRIGGEPFTAEVLRVRSEKPEHLFFVFIFHHVHIHAHVYADGWEVVMLVLAMTMEVERRLMKKTASQYSRLRR